MALKLIHARQAITDATALNYRKRAQGKPIFIETKSSKLGANLKSTRASASNVDKIIDGVQAGKVLAIISKMDKDAIAWAWFAYGPDIVIGDLDRVLEFVYRAHVANHGKDSLKTFKRSRRIQKLIVSAVLNVRSLVQNGRERFNVVERCSDAEINPDVYARDWAKLYDEMIYSLESLDEKVIRKVIPLVIREKEKAEINEF